MQKINVSVVSYANSVPFVYGLQNSEVLADINLSLDMPAACADKLLNGTVDIGLIPIVETLRMKEYEIVSDLCIGAVNDVKTVIIASNTPIEELSQIYLDYQSRTSVVLARVLAKYHWKINPQWIPATKGFETEALSKGAGAVIIGDRTFSVKSKYRYDLACEWKTLTGLPFVFAGWVANKHLDDNFKVRFNQALLFGTQHIEESVNLCPPSLTFHADIVGYLQNNISYPLDAPKRKAMNMFLDYAREFVKA
jgi:chorismate dehydratase